MGRYPKDPNAICVDCEIPFVKAPSSKVIRCDSCRKGMRGIGKGGQRKNYVCPSCGGKKAAVSNLCAECWKQGVLSIMQTVVNDKPAA